jgi:predicted RND superfamily exporter protein
MPLLSLQADFRSMASDLPVYEEAQEVERVMGASGEIVVTVEGDAVMDPESLAWMQDVRREVAARHGDELKPVLSPPALLGFLGEEPTDDQLAAAMRLLPRYLVASVVSPSGDMAVMSYGVRLDDIGELQRLRADLDSLVTGAPEGLDVRLGGLPVVAVSAYEALEERRFVTAALGVFAAGLVLLVLLPRREVAVLAVLSAAITSGLVLLGMWAGGLGLTPITAAVGSLAAAVACELTVVLAHAVRVGDRRIVRAVGLAAAASATGYGVLALSDLALIRGFGLVLAVTVLLALAASRLVVWAFLEKVAATAPPTENKSRAPARSLVEMGR